MQSSLLHNTMITQALQVGSTLVSVPDPHTRGWGLDTRLVVHDTCLCSNQIKAGMQFMDVDR